MTQFPGGLIRGTPVVPTLFGSAPGMWTLAEVLQHQAQGIWPARVQASGSFNGSSARLTRAFTAGNTKLFTIRALVRRAAAGAAHGIIGYTNGSTTSTGLQFTAANTLEFFNWNSGYNIRKITTATYTNGVWWDVVAAVNTDAGTAANRNRIYVNGVEVTAFGTDTNASVSLATNMNVNALTYAIGDDGAASPANRFNGLMAEVSLVDGAQQTPFSFGYFDSSGAWKPKRPRGLTFGPNGAYLPFMDSAALGADESGLGLNWTNANVSQSATVP